MKIFEDYLMYFISSDNQLFYNKWLRPVSSEEIRKGSKLTNSILEASSASLWLVDASNCKTPDKEDQEWMAAELCTLLCNGNTRLEKMALVKSRDVFFNVIAEFLQYRLQQQFGSSTFFRDFESLPEAHAWLLAQEPVIGFRQYPFLGEGTQQLQ